MSPTPSSRYGGQLVAQTLHARHDVTPVVRDPTTLPTTAVRPAGA